jgi:signal transduction histidine kinase/CheY-like chemotaxis protein
MKSRVGYLYWIITLAFGLMLLIAAAQLLAKRNISILKIGNRDAAVTFTINNRLQDLINLSFELESKVTNPSQQKIYRQSLLDSLTVLGYNSSVLKQLNLTDEAITRFEKLGRFIDTQISLSNKAIQLSKQSNQNEAMKLIDSIRVLRLADSIYSAALSIEKYLEKDLQATLSNNTNVSSRLSAYNRLLAIVAIAGVLILGTIIINRHLKQVQLISDLEVAKTQAQESAKIKEQFLANMSHEIRTPLNAIQGFSQILSRTPLSREQQKYSTIISDASESLIYIVNDILDISKIEAGKLRMQQKPFNLEKVLKKLDNMFSHVAAEKELQYIQHTGDDVPLYLTGDPDRLLQILVNLISNAIKFTQAGSVQIDIEKISEKNETVWLSFKVKDTGVGISADKKDIIFQRFEQLNPGKDSPSKGTGLGLSIVKSLTEMKGGNITLSSIPGSGSEFIVSIPFNKVKKPELLFREEEADQLVNFENAAILVVEDNKVNQLLLKHNLSQAGCLVDIVENGEEALAVLNNKVYDLILMDIQMPVMDGYETIHKLRKMMQINTPVIAMTAYAMSGEKEKCLAAGMNDYIAKPVDFSLLTSALKKYLSGRESAKKNKKSDINGQEEFLLHLAGGDTRMAKKILQEIISEIPVVTEKLKALAEQNHAEGIDKLLHNMVSTFSPLGNETTVMQKINTIREVLNTNNREEEKKMIHELVFELEILSGKLTATVDSVN